MTDETTQAAAEGQQVQFGIQRIYMKDCSFEAPNGLSVGGKWQPKVNQDLNTEISRVKDDLYEVVLNLTIKVDAEEGKAAFLVEVHQAGLFAVKGLDEQPLKQLLSSQCPQILFPYAREAIDNLVTRGGFPPLMLPPINFDALYVQAMQQMAEQQQATETEH
ncbi:protein-export chaperone SecB [Agaribacterium haliotis]|uniref:protein-export chaperone SecB n=1 Tax=Agaribacterium haliotis TaxID=2013869 RepID=UPI000BB59330|nr:protein-export chaperone SecB [Agaribacterium haliotis]